MKNIERKKVCVFCGASNDVPQVFKDMAYQFGLRLGQEGYDLVYGGGGVAAGMMGRVADGVLHGGGEVTGIFPEILDGIEDAHNGLNLLIKTKTMHERKIEMYNRSDAFVILPGGYGTLDEAFEIITLKLLGDHVKPIIFYNHLGFWDSFVKMTQNIISHGFAKANTQKIYTVVNSKGDVFKELV